METHPPVWMGKGDEIEVKISSTGVPRNPIMEEQPWNSPSPHSVTSGFS